ncbi:MAG: serine/threonine protein kinase, partial [Acidobacteria bacterium]|nr:serine/threonine protein kinase [Acidobacteriota bacterium]
KETDEIVAIKVLKPEIASDPELISRFKNELRLARKITHRNACRSYELMRFGNVVAIAMEFVEGDTLRSVLNRFGGVPIRRGLEWTRQICSVLAEAHAQGIVHRDLKPENIVITNDGTLKVMDFGIARSLESGATMTGTLVGTPAYMSPEQIEGKPADARSDIYSLGLVLYEMFTGRRAFQADSAVSLAHKQVHEDPPAPRAIDPFIPDLVDAVIRRCLHKRPEKRFQSIAELDAALNDQRLAAAANPDFVPEIPVRLSLFSNFDKALLVLAVVSLIYGSSMRSIVLETRDLRLEIDSRAAQRKAEEIALKLGRPFPTAAEVRLDYGGFNHRYPMAVTKRPQPRPLELLRWKVSFSGTAATSNEPLRYAIIARDGSVREYVNELTYRTVRPTYKPPPPEERRLLARRVAEDVCGKLNSTRGPVETHGGEFGAAYAATWRGPGLADALPVAEVTLFAEQPVAIRCRPAGTLPEDPLEHEMTRVTSQALIWSVLIPFVVGAVGPFVIRQHYRSPLLVKRLPLALLSGFSSAWTIGPNFNFGPLSLTALIVSGLFASFLFLAAMITIEENLKRRSPEIVATYCHAVNGRFLDRGVAVTLIRGVFWGFVILGIETGFAHIMLSEAFRDRWGSLVQGEALNQTLASPYPALFAVSSAIAHGAFAALILAMFSTDFANLYKSLSSPLARKCAIPVQLVSFGLAYALVASYIGLHFPPLFSVINAFVPIAVVAILVAWLALQYDLLTVIVAVTTAVLWGINLPLLEIFTIVGNTAEIVALAGWFIAVAAGVALGFRREILRELKGAQEP